MAPRAPIDLQRVLASVKLGHVAVRVPDFEASKRWFVEKLDFRVVIEWPYGELRLAYLVPPADDTVCIEILGGGSPTCQPQYADLGTSLYEAGYHHVCLDVDSVDDILAELRRRGVTIVAEAFELKAIGRRLAFFADPWGNLFELAQVIHGAPD